ncbi:MAG: kinase [bacterium]|nr:kinase [bacterium]
MIITRTPYRISFFGGGTDYPAWYEKNGGAVLATSINKYSYISARFLPPFFKHKHRIVYDQQESVNKIDEIDHPSVRETMRFLNVDKGLEIHHDGDLPAMSGLGSSSSFTVGLLNALYGLNGQTKNKRQLALNAIHIEQNMINENVGSQDQTTAAFGSLNKIEFGGTQEIAVYPIVMKPARHKELQDHLMLFFTDFPRNASEIAKEQIKLTPKKNTELNFIRQTVDEGIDILQSDQDINEFGKLLNNAWKVKRTLSSKISNPKLDAIYTAGLKAGATGGKLLGAGGGGFMLFFVKPELQKNVREKLKKLLYVPFHFEHSGSQIIYLGHTDDDYY